MVVLVVLINIVINVNNVELKLDLSPLFSYCTLPLHNEPYHDGKH